MVFIIVCNDWGQMYRQTVAYLRNLPLYAFKNIPAPKLSFSMGSAGGGQTFKYICIWKKGHHLINNSDYEVKILYENLVGSRGSGGGGGVHKFVLPSVVSV